MGFLLCLVDGIREGEDLCFNLFRWEKKRTWERKWKVFMFLLWTWERKWGKYQHFFLCSSTPFEFVKTLIFIIFTNMKIINEKVKNHEMTENWLNCAKFLFLFHVWFSSIGFISLKLAQILITTILLHAYMNMIKTFFVMYLI